MAKTAKLGSSQKRQPRARQTAKPFSLYFSSRLKDTAGKFPNRVHLSRARRCEVMSQCSKEWRAFSPGTKKTWSLKAVEQNSEADVPASLSDAAGAAYPALDNKVGDRRRSRVEFLFAGLWNAVDWHELIAVAAVCKGAVQVSTSTWVKHCLRVERSIRVHARSIAQGFNMQIALGVASLALAFWRDVCDRCARRQYLGLHCSGRGSYVAQILHAEVEVCATVALHHGAISSPLTTEHCRISHILASANGAPCGKFHYFMAAMITVSF